jgi:isopentenyl-diphosphate Delta-isomerase
MKERVAEQELVVLVDERDREIGIVEKLRAHVTGERHRAVSVFVFDAIGRILLQRRADDKYHSAGRWANTCCSHPRPGEAPADAAQRRLREEMGLDCALTAVGNFTYRADVGGGLVEHELDHVFVGRSASEPVPDPGEVREYRWAHLDDIVREMRERPNDFVAWLAPAMAALRRAGALAWSSP